MIGTHAVKEFKITKTNVKYKSEKLGKPDPRVFQRLD
jgi:hypothetical protein